MKTFKSVISLILVLIAVGSVCVFAESANTSAHIEKMFSLIDNQNFENTLGVDYVKEKVRYLVYDSQYAASKTAYFKYPNEYGYSGYNGNGYTSVYDSEFPTEYGKGMYVYLRGQTWGCMTYARFANTVVNGGDPASYNFLLQGTGDITGDGLKEFLQTYAQAGEHLRIDSTHSVAYISGDEEGFYYLNYNNDGYPFITMEYETYDVFADRYKDTPVNYEDTLKNDYPIWLYEANCNINEKKPVAPPPTTPPSQNTVTPGASVPEVVPVTPGASVPDAACSHEKYDSCGYCKKCGKAFPMAITAISPTEYTVINSAPIRVRPYAVVKNSSRFKVGEKVSVVASAYNSYGKLWYQVKSERLGANAYWIYEDNIARVNTVKIELVGTTDTGDSYLTLNGTCSYTTQRPNRISLYVGTEKDKLTKVDGDVINHSVNPFKIWYKITGIKKDTVYYYRLVAEYDKIEYEAFFDKQSLVSQLGTFMIPSTKVQEQQNVQDVQKPDISEVDKIAEELINASMPIKLDLNGVTSLTDISARFNAVCTYIGTRPSYVCLYLGLSADTTKMWQVGYDAINHSQNPFDIWYDVSGMAKNTVYYYQFRAELDGRVYVSKVGTVTTGNKSSIDNAMSSALAGLANTRTGVVSGTSLLAINDKAAASPTYSTMIGTIPSGATVTVYPDKQSGNWYYVTYNGISGYVYGTYIKLK